MYGDLKFLFTQKVLAAYLDDVADAMKTLIRKGAYQSGDLLSSVDTRLLENTGELLFNEYGRMLDMGVSRGHPLGSLTRKSVALQGSNTSGTALVRDKSRRRKLIYSRIAYGKLNYLENQLLYGFTQEAIEGLKKDFNQANQ